MTTENNPPLNDHQTTLFRLVQRYVDRQRIVRQAIKELRPEFFDRADFNSRHPSNIQLTSHEFDELFRLNMPNPEIPQSGRWGTQQEWIYFFHGLGCRLTHIETKECVDWNVPDINVFDVFAFIHWLSSLMMQTDDDLYVQMAKSLPTEGGQVSKTLVFDGLYYLKTIGKLSAPDDYSYSLALDT